MSQMTKNLYLNHLTLKTQLECTSINAGLPQSTNISSTLMPLTTDKKGNSSDVQAVHKTNMNITTFKFNTR